MRMGSAILGSTRDLTTPRPKSPDVTMHLTIVQARFHGVYADLILQSAPISIALGPMLLRQRLTTPYAKSNPLVSDGHRKKFVVPLSECALF